ncbi:MAG: phosphoribosyltransferase family protein [archaeon]
MKELSNGRLYYCFEEFNEDIRGLVEKIRKTFIPDVLIGLGVGGWVPAASIKEMLKMNECYSIGVRSYDQYENSTYKPMIYQDVCDEVVRGKKVLLIDEVCEEGTTLDFVMKHLLNKNPKEIKSVVLHNKGHSKFEPDYCIDVDNKWILYFWKMQV